MNTIFLPPLPLHPLITLQVPNIIAAAGHLPGVNRSLIAEPGDEAAGGVGAAAGGDGLGDAGHVAGSDVVEGRAAPVALGLGGFLFHREYAVVPVHFGDAGFVEAGFVGFVVAHYAGCAFCAGVVEEVAEAEGEEVVAGHDEEVVRCPIRSGMTYGVDSKLYILDCS